MTRKRKKQDLMRIRTTPIRRRREPSAMSVNALALALKSRAERVTGKGKTALTVEPDPVTMMVVKAARARPSPTHSQPLSFVGRSFLTSGKNSTATSSANIHADLKGRVSLCVSKTVTNNLQEQLHGVLKEKEEKSNSFAMEVEALQAAQRHATLLSEVTKLQSESAQRQFIAFAKVK